MKKKITQLRWLVTTFLLVAAMVMPSTAWAQESTVTFTAKEGTAGFSDNESFDKLIDGKFTSDDFTKWCLTFPSDGAYIIFCASEPILVSGYSIVTGNDNAKEKARNPKSWALYGCNDESAGRNSDSWVLIDQKVEDTDLQDVNYQKYDFTLSNLSSEKYQYFKMEITATKGSSVLQMSELILTYTTCNHQWVKTGDVVDPTCTEGGYDVCKCSLCQLTKNEANDNGALGHQWVDGDVVPPTCTTDGYTPQTCSRCHAEQIINIVNATGHQWGNDDVCDVCQINNTVLNIPQGDGTLANPYKISTVGELYWFAGLVNGDASVCNDVVNQNTAACAKLMNDIVVNYDDDFSNHNWNSISRSNWFFWTPIGKQDINIYTGTFDGQGHTISGLYFESCSNYYDQNSKEYDYQYRDNLSFGLFGFNSGTIKNVGVINSYFGWQYNLIGGICGENSGTIENCYNAGKVEGKGFYTGGICARNLGTITNCYNLGTVIGEYGTGGVCVDNFETIKNCYYLSGTATGGINGADVEGSAESKTADQFKSGEVAWLLNGKRSEGTTGNPLAWYQNIGGDPYPVLDSSHGTVYCGYKDCTLSYSNNPEGLSKNPVHNYDNGICKACKAYQPATLNASSLYEISNAGQLYWFAALVNGTLGGETKNASANAELTADITVNTGVLKSDGTLAGNYSNFETWIPIGYPYAGTFDGKGHTISGLYFNDRSPSYIGLFGSNSGTIKNVGVVDSYFCGKERVGGVCGNNDGGTITGCYNTGTISGNQYVGGVCGCNTINISTNSSGTITCSYNTGAVSCNDNSVGGVCGQNSSGTITNCYYLSGTATGGIDSNDMAGSAEAKTTTQFASGEVCYLLNGKRSEGTEANPLAWYQNISPDSRDTYPVLTGTGTNTVYQVEILCGGTDYVGKTYSNTNKNITVEHILTGPADFNSAKNIYYKICQREGCGKTLYYADADGTIKATPNAEKTAFAVASYTLADATEYNSKAEFTVTSLAYKRTFYDDKWMAVYVPFAIDCSKLESYYEMATINNFHEYEQEDGTYNVVLEVKRVTKGGTIPALTPCLMRMKTAPAAKVEKTLTFENAAFSAAANKSIDCSSVTRYYKFSGTLDGKTGLTADTDFVLNAGKLYNTSKDTELLPQRWYLSATDRNSTSVEPAAMLRSISINVIGDGEATGIEDIHVNTESGADASGSTGIYDLQGRKINSEPTKGMYIKNGKKYIK